MKYHSLMGFIVIQPATVCFKQLCILCSALLSMFLLQIPFGFRLISNSLLNSVAASILRERQISEQFLGNSITYFLRVKQRADGKVKGKPGFEPDTYPSEAERPLVRPTCHCRQQQQQ